MRFRSECDNDLSCLTTPEGTQNASHIDLVMRRCPAVPCRTSVTIVEIILEIPDSNTDIMQIGRVSDTL